MSTRFKWILEDTIEKGNRYAKIYHGRYEAERNTKVCEYVNNPKTFINYGIVVSYCPRNKEVFFGLERPKDKAYRHFGENCRHIDVRLTTAEMGIIKENKNIIDVKMLDAILNRDV